ncbi:toxin-antitoxin system HicB family antitoxin, partial [Salmonella enterica subsp. enterica]|nr:toxin-antitoxin system HicB family antitoxin [Salmonella enterica subsp. enterica serovar Newport]
MKHLKYKGYLGTVEPDFENNVLYGKLAFIRDLVTYEASTLAELEQEFKTSV